MPATTATQTEAGPTGTPAVLLFGLFGGGNFGNEASLEAMLLTLSRVMPDAQIECACSGPEVIARLHGIKCHSISPVPSNILYRVLNRLLLRLPNRIVNLLMVARIVRRFDVLLVPGTGLLDDFGDGPFDTPFLIMAWCALARLLGTHVWFISIGAGPCSIQWHGASRACRDAARRSGPTETGNPWPSCVSLASRWTAI